MGVSLVGKKHQREADTSQGPDRELEAVLNRICGASGGGCASTNRQQSFQPQESSSDKREHLMGALLSRRVASKGAIHARRIHRLCEELDSPSMGQRAAGRTKNRRGGTLAAGSESGGRDQGQTQVCDVGFVFARRALGVLWPQSHFVGNSSGDRRKARSKHWRSRECKASRSTPVLVTRASETGSREIGISGPVARVSGWSVGDSPRRTRRPALVGLRLRQHELQRSTLVLLAQRRASEGDKNGSVGEAITDASGVERCLNRMEVAERTQRTWGFRFPIPSSQREEAVGSCRRAQAEDSTGVCEGWRYRRGLAHVSTHRGDVVGRDGRTSTNDPRLLTAQQSPRDEQVSSSNTGAEALGARKTSRCHLAGRFAVGEQINFDSIVEPEGRVFWTFEERAADRALLGLVDPNGPRFFFGSAVSA